MEFVNFTLLIIIGALTSMAYRQHLELAQFRKKENEREKYLDSLAPIRTPPEPPLTDSAPLPPQVVLSSDYEECIVLSVSKKGSFQDRHYPMRSFIGWAIDLDTALSNGGEVLHVTHAVRHKENGQIFLVRGGGGFSSRPLQLLRPTHL